MARKSSASKKDVIASDKKPIGFLIVDSAIWWEANPDKSKKYVRKEFRGKKYLTPKEAEMFLEVNGEWLTYFIRGEKGFPKLAYSWDGKNVATLKFARTDLVEYRKVMQGRKFPTKARPPRIDPH